MLNFHVSDIFKLDKASKMHFIFIRIMARIIKTPKYLQSQFIETVKLNAKLTLLHFLESIVRCFHQCGHKCFKRITVVQDDTF